MTDCLVLVLVEAYLNRRAGGEQESAPVPTATGNAPEPLAFSQDQGAVASFENAPDTADEPLAKKPKTEESTSLNEGPE